MAATRLKSATILARQWTAAGLPQLSAVSCGRNYSDDVRFLKSLDAAHMKRGRGGRSSFSGTVCTVFGATGFIGRYVANRLGKVGSQMIFPYRGDFYDVRHLKVAGDLGQVLFCPYHLCSEEDIYKAVKYSDVVINLVGRDWATLNFSLDQVHTEGAGRIARMCKKAGVEKLIHVSALNCDRKHEGFLLERGSPLLKAKYAGEQAVLEEFPDATIIRPSDVFGEGDRFLRYFASMWRSDYFFTNTFLALPNGGYDIYKQPVFVSDLAKAIVTIATKDIDCKGQIYQAVGPRRYELREMVEWFMRLLRRDPLYDESTKIVNMKYYPFMRLKAMGNELCPWTPFNGTTTDKLERESVTDEVSPNLPTLEDLGVTLTKIEDKAHWIMRPHRAYEYFEEEVGDFPAPAPPKFMAA